MGVLLVVLCTACGGEDVSGADAEPGTEQADAQPTTDPSPTPTASPDDGLPDPCTVFDTAELEAAFGVTFESQVPQPHRNACDHLADQGQFSVTIGVVESDGDVTAFREGDRGICVQDSYREIDAGDGGYACSIAGAATAGAVFGDAAVYVTVVDFSATISVEDASGTGAQLLSGLDLSR